MFLISYCGGVISPTVCTAHSWLAACNAEVEEDKQFRGGVTAKNQCQGETRAK